jgi:hypothetical protein
VDVNTYDWIRNLLFVKVMAGTFTATEEEKFIDVCLDASLKIKLLTLSVPEFCISVQN